MKSALSNLPEPGPPASDATRTLRGALLLTAGRVDQTESEIKSLPSSSPLASALREIVPQMCPERTSQNCKICLAGCPIPLKKHWNLGFL